MITALLERIEDMYTAAEEIILGGGYSGILSNWIMVAIIVCAVAFVIDQTIWMFVYRPYKRWIQTVRGFNRGADRILDAILGLMDRMGLGTGGAKAGGDIADNGFLPDPGSGALPLADNNAKGRQHTDKGIGVTAAERPAVVPVAAMPPKHETPRAPADWTSIPASYEGVRWWEPADKEQI